MKQILSIFFISNYLEFAIASICLWNSGCPYNYFSTKTPYSVVRGDIRDSLIKVHGCEPYSIWGLFRHGKTNPRDDIAKNMEKVINIRDDILVSQKKGNCSLCAQDIDNLRSWTKENNIFNSPYGLTHNGFKEMAAISNRLKQAFSKLLSDLNNGSYIFRPAGSQEIIDSAVGFIDGLENKKIIIQKPKISFDVMTPYAACEKYQMEIKNKSSLSVEASKYQKSSDYLMMKDRIQRRTGLDYTLSDEDIMSVYDLCRYTSTGFGSLPSPWCALYTTDDLQILEYVKDLNNYYYDGYGRAINERLGQIPLADLLAKFREAKDGQGTKVVAYFGHSKVLSMLYTALGAFKDKQLTGSHRNDNRNWRSSKLTAFSANFIAVLNRCTKDGAEDFNVVFYRNEEPLRSICEQGICTWQEFEDKLKRHIDDPTDLCE